MTPPKPYKIHRIGCGAQVWVPTVIGGKCIGYIDRIAPFRWRASTINADRIHEDVHGRRATVKRAAALVYEAWKETQ